MHAAGERSKGVKYLPVTSRRQVDRDGRVRRAVLSATTAHLGTTPALPTRPSLSHLAGSKVKANLAKHQLWRALSREKALGVSNEWLKKGSSWKKLRNMLENRVARPRLNPEKPASNPIPCERGETW